MSCPSTRNSNKLGYGVSDDGSDYGSDFTPDEEELLTELLLKIAGGEAGTSAGKGTQTTATAALQQVAQPAFVVTDIEDYEEARSVPFPRVLGREQWSLQRQRQIQSASHVLPAIGNLCLLNLLWWPYFIAIF
jgi:exonuclease V